MNASVDCAAAGCKLPNLKSELPQPMLMSVHLSVLSVGVVIGAASNSLAS